MLQHRRSFGCLVRAALMFCFWRVVLRFEIDGCGRLRHRSRFDCRFQVFSWISVEWEVTNQGPGRLWTLEVALFTVLRSAPYILTRTSEAKHNEQQTARTTKTSDSYTSMLKGVPFGGRFYAIGLGFEGRPLDSPRPSVYVRISMNLHGYPWMPMCFHPCPWFGYGFSFCISMDIHAYPFVVCIFSITDLPCCLTFWLIHWNFEGNFGARTLGNQR